MREQKFPLKCGLKKNQNTKKSHVRNVNIVKHFQPKVIHKIGCSHILPEVNADVDIEDQLSCIKLAITTAKKNVINKNKSQNSSKSAISRKLVNVETKKSFISTTPKSKKFTQIISPLKSKSFQDSKLNSQSNSQTSASTSNRFKSKSFDLDNYTSHTTLKISSKSSNVSDKTIVPNLARKQKSIKIKHSNTTKQPKSIEPITNKQPNMVKALSYEKVKKVDSQKLNAAAKSKSFPSTNRFRYKIEQKRNKKLISSSDSEQTDNYLTNLKNEIANNAINSIISKSNPDQSNLESDIIKFRQRRISELRDELHMLMNMKLKDKRAIVVDLKSEIAEYKKSAGEMVYNVEVKDIQNDTKDQPNEHSCRCPEIENNIGLDFSSMVRTNPDKTYQDSSTHTSQQNSSTLDSSVTTENEERVSEQKCNKEKSILQCIPCNTEESSSKTDEEINKKIEKATILINRVKQTLNEIKSKKSLNTEDDQQTFLSTNESIPASENDDKILSNVKIFETSKIPICENDFIRPKTRRSAGCEDEIVVDTVEKFKTIPTGDIAESDITDFEILQEKLNTIVERSETEDTSSITDKQRKDKPSQVETVSTECNTDFVFQSSKCTQMDHVTKKDDATTQAHHNVCINSVPKEATTQTTNSSVSDPVDQTRNTNPKLAAANVGIVDSKPCKLKLCTENVQFVEIPPKNISEFSKTQNVKNNLRVENTSLEEIPPIEVIHNSQLTVQLLPPINIPTKLEVKKIFIYSLEQSTETITYHPEAKNIGFFLHHHVLQEANSSFRSNILSMNENSSPTPTLLRVQSMLNTMGMQREYKPTLINLANLIADYKHYTESTETELTSFSKQTTIEKMYSASQEASLSSLHEFDITYPANDSTRLNQDDKKEELTLTPSEEITIINLHESFDKLKVKENSSKEQTPRENKSTPKKPKSTYLLDMKRDIEFSNITVHRPLSITPIGSNKIVPISDKDLVLKSFHVYDNQNIHDPGILEAHSIDMLHTSMDDNVYKTFINPEGLQVLTNKVSRKMEHSVSQLKQAEKGLDEKEMKSESKEFSNEKGQKITNEKQHKEPEENKSPVQDITQSPVQESDKVSAEEQPISVSEISKCSFEPRKSVTYAESPRIYKIGLYESKGTQCQLDQKFSPTNPDDYEKISFSVSYSTEEIASPESTISIEHLLTQPLPDNVTIDEEVEREFLEYRRNSRKSVLQSISIPDSAMFKILKEKIGKEHPIDTKSSFQLSQWVDSSEAQDENTVHEPVVPDFISGLISDAPGNLGKIIPVIRKNLRNKTDCKDDVTHSDSVDNIKKEKNKKNEHTIMHVQICGDCMPTNVENELKYINPLEVGDTGRYKDEENLFCESNYPQFEDLVLKKQKFRYIPYFTVNRSSRNFYNWKSSASESNTTVSSAEKSLSDGEINCNCSVSYGEIHQCPDLNRISSLWKSTLLHKGKQVKIHKRRTHFNNIMTYYINKHALLNDSTSSSTVK